MIDHNVLILVWLPLTLAVAINLIRRKTSFVRTFCMLMLTTYVCALVAVTLFPIPFQAELLDLRRSEQVIFNNYYPFRTISDVLAHGGTRVLLLQLGGNLFLLIPLTFLLPILYRRFRSFKSTVIVAVAVSLSIEFLQLIISAVLGFTYKVTDVDDLIINVFGAMIGYGVYAAIDCFVRIRVVDSRLSQRSGMVKALHHIFAEQGAD